MDVNDDDSGDNEVGFCSLHTFTALVKRNKTKNESNFQ